MYQNDIPRPEYPRPQMVRDKWLNLNGTWEFEIDQSDSGHERGLMEQNLWSRNIRVPFCPESTLSTVHYTDFMKAVWYRRCFSIPEEWGSSRVLLHFGAVDYEATVWINNQEVGRHSGGYSSFWFDITAFLREGENVLAVRARDDLLSGGQARGKQSRRYHSFECEYTRTTGIWQTVWLEPVPERWIERCRYFPDAANNTLSIETYLQGNTNGMSLRVKAFLSEVPAGVQCTVVSGNYAALTIPLSSVKYWTPDDPVLYDLQLSLERKDGVTEDQLTSYFGLRSVAVSGNKVLLNNKPEFQRLVLDQGFYPNGVYTAPSDEDLRRDIEISLDMGFNGARLHQKVFEPRFLYWADKMGYLVWGEYGDTGLNLSDAGILASVIPEWLEVIARDFNSPALIVWCPFNETRDWSVTGARQKPEVIMTVYQLTKALDPTRPVVDASGFIHGQTDIFDVHEYEQDATHFSKMFDWLQRGDSVYNTHPNQQEYNGQPYMVSEYGGTWWNPGGTAANEMSYGRRPSTQDEFIERYAALTGVLLNAPDIAGFCYTQLYDVEQEVNGLYTYQREPKFLPETIRRINTQTATMEISIEGGCK